MPSIKRLIWWFSPLVVLGILFYQFYGSEEALHYVWEESVDRALERASLEGRDVLLLASATECGACRELKARTLADERVARTLSDRFVLLFLEAPQGREEFAKIGLDIAQAPTLFVLDETGRERDRIEGFVPPDALLAWLRTID